ncbi:peptidoglycan editing factor PgeF [Picosynechococcus sp. PCC 11901]|uniref:peptidoglycan editing factor PgeF n=1 Tax=Picosynechococcus sp. PCC 11901 TaxID=2579791 RepID=UPI0010FC0727|nr:peptidoglycan editing factor PgeF [Picosynechococcus sp. PCC 11901]QCS49680.1 peptidoglycan editing factor PgeF [Picosynechococcus sp. PCC 11901]
MGTVTAADQWHWQEWEGRPYLTCELLEPWHHGFFTQAFAPELPENLVKIFHPELSAYRVKQVHGNTVLTPHEINWEGEHFSPADGIVSTASQQAVFVATADCTPALIGDRRTGQVAAIHAGWRGTAKRIIPEAIQKFLDAGSEIKDLLVALGPAISGEVYQVSTDVAVEMGVSLGLQDLADDLDGMLLALENLLDSPILPDDEHEKVRLDVRRVNQLQLEQLGLDLGQMAIAPHCTYQQPEHFFSYRRSNQKNVQWSGIVSR